MKVLIAKPIVDILLQVKAGTDPGMLLEVLRDDGWMLMARNMESGHLDLCTGYPGQLFRQGVPPAREGGGRLG